MSDKFTGDEEEANAIVEWLKKQQEEQEKPKKTPVDNKDKDK